MAWRIVFIVVVWVANFSDGDKLFPKPSLTQHRSRVMRLECKPPLEASSDWLDVHDIRVFICPPRYDICSNHTVASMTSAMATAKLGKVLPSIAKVTFSGTWTPAGSPSLTVETPFSSEYYGVYFCTAEYSSSDGTIQNYTAAIHANVSGQAKFWRDNFHIEIMEAHALNVTWQSPIGSAFQEGVVTRMPTDREGTVTAAARSLFMATAKKNFTYDDEGVLLARFEPPYPPEQNYTMAVYVDSKMCSPFCQYSCSVPYKACIGPDALFCECNHEENVAPPAAASAGLSKGSVAAICLVIVVCVVLIIVLSILLIRAKLRIKTLLNARTVNEDVNTRIEAKDSNTQTENVALATKQRIQEPPNNLEYEMTPKKPHGNKSKNRQRHRQKKHPDSDTPSSDDPLTQDIHHRDEDSDLPDEPETPPSDDAPSSQEETDDQGATGGENTPLVYKESDNTQPGTEKKRALHPSPEQAARISKTMGGGGARPKDTHQNPAASLSSQPDMGTSVFNPSSTSKYSDLNPPQAEESTPKQQQSKAEFDYAMRGADNMKGDYSLRSDSKSALNVRNLNNAREQPKSGMAETDL
ncbi:uncharacterized protein [Littorina saxatilis]|uniref:uncharacterized protein n=1 Tax=Littorina saxatilis TaxID=31220 RepID=UPI0038B5E248